MLEGRIAGLSIQNVTGSFGAAPRINIRGGASIMGNVQPLWVIDGAVYEDLVSLTLDQLASGDAVTLISSAVAGLNASDIEDIQVLKDAGNFDLWCQSTEWSDRNHHSIRSKEFAEQIFLFTN